MVGVLYATWLAASWEKTAGLARETFGGVWERAVLAVRDYLAWAVGIVVAVVERALSWLFPDLDDLTARMERLRIRLSERRKRVPANAPCGGSAVSTPGGHDDDRTVRHL